MSHGEVFQEALLNAVLEEYERVWNEKGMKMRKRIMLRIFGLAFLLLVLFHCGKNGKEQSVNVQMDGIMIAQSGELNEIPIQITGTYIEQSSGTGEVDQFHFGEDGGIWIGETRLDISGIPFGNDASDYAYFEFSGNTIIINREADLFIVLMKSGQSNVVVASPCRKPDELMYIINQLSASDTENTHSTLLSEIRKYVE